MKYLVNSVDTYRVNTVEEVEQLHEELKADNHFTLAAFSYKTKQIKSKGEIIDEYQLVTAKKLFNDEKEPGTEIEIKYEVEF
jgi:hypothetical protein